MNDTFDIGAMSIMDFKDIPVFERVKKKCKEFEDFFDTPAKDISIDNLKMFENAWINFKR